MWECDFSDNVATGVVDAAYFTLFSNLQVDVFKLAFDFKVWAYIFLDLHCCAWWLLFKNRSCVLPGAETLESFGWKWIWGKYLNVIYICVCICIYTYI